MKSTICLNPNLAQLFLDKLFSWPRIATQIKNWLFEKINGFREVEIDLKKKKNNYLLFKNRKQCLGI